MIKANVHGIWIIKARMMKAFLQQIRHGLIILITDKHSEKPK